MLLGYCRVSKDDGTQVLDMQVDALIAAGVPPGKIYDDKLSGRQDDRPGLAACLKALNPGDTLVVWKLDRLGRNLRHLVNTLHQLSQDGIALKILNGAGAGLDTNTPLGKMIFTVMALLAEFESDMIRDRTLAGLAAAKARGRTGGRPFALQGTALDLAIHSRQTDKELAAVLHVHEATIYRARKRARLQGLPRTPAPPAPPSAAEAAD